MRTLQQRYAAAVYACIQEVKRKYKEKQQKQKEYGSLAMRLPVLVRQAGLVQALTFVDARQRDEHRHRILKDLATVLGFPSSEDLLKYAREGSLTEYIFLTQRVLWALEWFKRFAQAELNVEPGEGE